MRSQRNRVVHLVFIVFLCLTTINLQGQTTELSSFYASGNDTVHLFYIKNSQVFEAYSPYSSQTQSWQSQNLTLMASNGGVPVSGTDLSSFYIEENSNSPEHVFYRDGAGHIHELYSDSIGAWHDMDLTSASGGSVATHLLGSFYLNTNSPEHVFFSDSGQHIHELWSDSVGTWHDHDLTAITNGQLFVNGVVAFVGNSQSPEHVFYTGADLHVHELFLSTDDANWHDLDISAMAGIPVYGVGPTSLTGFYTGGAYPEQIFYQDQSGVSGGGAVHELYSDSSGTWHHQNLSTLTGSGGNVGALISFYEGGVSPEHIVYINTNDLGIYELFSDNSGWHNRLVKPGYTNSIPFNYGPLTGYWIGSHSNLSVFYQAYDSPDYTHPFIVESSTDSSGSWNSYFGLFQ